MDIPAYIRSTQHYDFLIRVSRSIHLDDRRAEDSSIGYLISTSKRTRATSKNGDREAVHEVLGIRKVGRECDLASGSVHSLQLLSYRQVLLIDVYQTQSARALRAMTREAELELLILWLNIRGFEIEWAENRHVDWSGARSWIDEVLIHVGVREWTS